MIPCKIDKWPGLHIGYRDKEPQAVMDFLATDMQEYYNKYKVHKFSSTDMHWTMMRNQATFKEYEKTNGIKSIEELKDKHSKKTAAIIGSGPSLDCHLEQLNKRRLVKFGINRANQKLKCDYVVCYDRWVPNDWYQHSDNNVLLTTATANSEILNLPWKDIYLFNTRFCAEPAFVKYPCLYIAYSTSILAIHVVAYLGFKKIEIYGNDYAYQGSYYSGNSSKIIHETDGKVINVLGTDGEKWQTTEMLYWHCKGMEAAIAFARYHGIEVINKSKGILRI